jgi:hypothetical protein
VWTRDSEAAAMEEGKDGILGLVGMRSQSRLGPDVECETVFILLIAEATGEFIDDREPIVSEVRELRLWCNIRRAITIAKSAILSLARQTVTYAF